MKRVPITLRGEPFPHLPFHYRLAWSGWAYGQIVHGGESFVALSEGLQYGLAACGGVPKELRTDRLSAASRNRDGSYALDNRFAQDLRSTHPATKLCALTTACLPAATTAAWPMRTALSRVPTAM